MQGGEISVGRYLENGATAAGGCAIQGVVIALHDAADRGVAVIVRPAQYRTVTGTVAEIVKDGEIAVRSDLKDGAAVGVAQVRSGAAVLCGAVQIAVRALDQGALRPMAVV